MKKEKIMVGMSGGVDSSVAALLLKKQGYEVAGMTLRLCPEDAALTGDRSGCGSQQDIEDAAKVCAALDIPHYIMDMTDVFAREVMRPFAEAYLNGQTPNPCVLCNPAVKFGAMLELALDMGYDAVATGHYAHITEENGRYHLYKAPAAKDQSYVLYTLTQHQLAHIRFPLFGMEKDAARKLAEEYHLPVAHKPDSEEICFVKDNDYAGFIQRFTGKTSPAGQFVDERGKVLGRHKGIMHYTIGQRKGLGVAFGKPMYVIGIDAKTNRVTLGEEGTQYARALTAEKVNWIPFERPESPVVCEARIRYQAKPAACTVFPLADGTVQVDFEVPQRSVTPGQSVVFSNGNEILGGGIIRCSHRIPL
jgi:tRNA-specific 2-thiouridylase